jgi:hypothetical protein
MSKEHRERRNDADGKYNFPKKSLLQQPEEQSTIVLLPLSYRTIPPVLRLPLLSQQRTQMSTGDDAAADDSSNWLLYRYTILMLASLVVFVVFLQIPNKKQTTGRETREREKRKRKPSSSILNLSMPSTTTVRENGVSNALLDRASVAAPVADTMMLQRSKQQMIAPVDPKHPSRDHTAPPLPLIDETLRMLQKANGIPLVAHGNHRPPEIIHLAYDAPNQMIRWWRPTASRVTAAAAATVRVSTIPLSEIVFVDVGKHTTALLRARPPIPDHVCFSLLTRAGSLDFETSSQLERDRMVSAFCVLLDSHPQEEHSNWRTLYERSACASSSSSTSIPKSFSSSSSGLFLRGSSSNVSSSTNSVQYTHF